MKLKLIIALLIAVGISGFLAGCGDESLNAWEIVQHGDNYGYRDWCGRVRDGYTNRESAVAAMLKTQEWSRDYDKKRDEQSQPGYWKPSK